MEVVGETEQSSLCFTLGKASEAAAEPGGADGAGRRRKESRSEARAMRFIRIRSHSKLKELAESDRQDDDADGDQDDPKQIAIRNASSGKIALRLARPLGQLGKVFIAELADGFVHFLIVEVSGLQRFLRLSGKNKRSNSFFFELPPRG